MQAAEQTAQIGDNSASYGQMIAEDPNIVFRDETVLPGLISEIEAEVASHEPDLSTDKGRKAIASLAAQIVRRKTAIDSAGKARNEDLRAKINVVDAVRRTVRERLDALRDRARAPLTEWEEAEKDREEKIEAVINRLKASASVPATATLESIDEEAAWVAALDIAPAEFGEFTIIARRAKENSVTALAEARARIIKAEEERAELERLRAEKEAAERAAREAEAKARAEQEERERIEAAERRAAEAAKHAAEEAATAERRKAQQERDAAEAEARRKHEAEIAQANREREEAQRERDRLEAERAREAAEKAKAEAEEAARARSRKLVAEARGAAKDAIIKASGITDEQAVKIVLAIHKGEVPGVSLKI